MTENPRQFDGPSDQWFTVGGTDHVLKTSDGFVVHIKRETRGWAARVTDLQRSKFRISREVYPSENELKTKCIEVIADMREQRAEKAQGKFAL